jgi:hypothetical protein
MRQMILALAVAAAGGFALASCGSSSNNNADMGKDMAGPAAGPDMSIAKTNCQGYGTCIYTCVSSGQGDINTCQTMCSKNAKPGSATKWINAVICGQNYCTGDADMMTGKCVSLANDPAKNGPNDPHTLCDPGVTITQCMASTYMSTSCSPCLSNARNYWFIDESVDPQNPGPPTFMCPMPTSADCTASKAACMTQFNACLNDM